MIPFLDLKITTQNIYNLIKSLCLFLYNSTNNAHHCILQSMGFFYLERR
ncbi:hypothetical protein AAX25_01394 [Aliarcobacter thereius]|nr:hypothetical protein AAX25_01394 [Aliarcobacter thereius]